MDADAPHLGSRARGLVGSKTYHAFVTLGFPPARANGLCKSVSVISARCSYAIYLGHSSSMWPHNNDLVRGKNSEPDPKVVIKLLKMQ